MRIFGLIAVILTFVCLTLAACGDDGSACGDCDDGVVCTSDACDAALGDCTHTPDHSLCGVGFSCDLVQGCVPSAPCEVNADCDDHNPCTFDVCEATGCVNNHNNQACDDGDACTENDTCSQGVCSGTAPSCDDQNPCTDDSCDPAQGCSATPNQAACDDGNACTEADACQAGVCQGQTLDCDDTNPCTTDTCDPAGGCNHENNTISCNDADACTEADTCAAGTCQGVARTCSDDNPCTDDGCDALGGCVFTDNTAACEDGNPCTQNDQCQTGTCVSGTNVCQCQNDGDCLPFDDGNPCNGVLICDNLNCVPDPATVITCDPALDTPCATSTCDPADGQCKLEAAADGSVCDDSNLCTISETCTAGQCNGSPIVCDDDDPCTSDGCDPASGCTASPASGAACDDADPCTENDICNNGSCVGAAKDCNDGNICTDDICDANGDCASVANSASCDDGDACTDGDNCALSTCQSGQEICCTGGVDDDGDGATDCDDAGCMLDPACVSYDVDWCRLHFPTAIDTLEDSVVTVFGHLNVSGLTDLSAGVDSHPDVLGQVGYGPDGSQPSDGGWSWTDAGPNPAWDDVAGGEVDNDEYMADLQVPAAGGSPYDYAYRFSADGGSSWTYCDTNAGLGADGSEDGYAPANAGQMTSTSASFQVDWCRLHTPQTIVDTEGSRVTVYGHLNILGLTDQSSGNDAHLDVLAQLGWGLDDSQPDASWTWAQALPNPGWDDTLEPGNDEYMADLLVPPAAGSPYDYAFRFSADAGQSWTLCDTDRSGQGGADGSADGYTPADAGQLTAQAGNHDDSNWDFEEAWLAGENPPDFLLSSLALSADPEAIQVSDGSQAARLTWDEVGGQSLQTGWHWAGVQPGIDYTLHAWVLDEDAAGALRPALSFEGAIEAGTLSTDGATFAELTHTAQTGAAVSWLAGAVLVEDQAGWDGDASLVVDELDLTQALGFDTSDGDLDAWASTSPATPLQLESLPHPLHASINDSGVMYVATDAMAPGPTDMMLFVWLGGIDDGASLALPWGKTGNLAAPAAGGTALVLIQEESNAWCEWRYHDGADWLDLSSDCLAGSVLEGQVDLAALLGVAPAALPARFHLAATRINTGDAGTMWSSSQTPVCVDCINDRIDENETASIHRARLLVGRVK